MRRVLPRIELPARPRTARRSARGMSSSGRTTRPRARQDAGQPARRRRRGSAEAETSRPDRRALWPTAIDVGAERGRRVAPGTRTARPRAASSTERRSSRASARTSRAPDLDRQRRAPPPSSRQNASSPSASAPRSWWLKCASAGNRRARRPPRARAAGAERDRIGPAGQRHERRVRRARCSACRRMVRRTRAERVMTMRMRIVNQRQRPIVRRTICPFAAHSPLHRSKEKWCRCRDLNPGQRGYEPRALTN